MRKYIIAFLSILIIVSGCTKETTHNPVDFQIVGRYVCSSDYFSYNYFVNFPNHIPTIIFHEDGTCELVVNYFGGVVTVFGVYRIDNDVIFVDLNLNDTISEVHVIKDGEAFVELRPNFIVFEEGDVKYMDDHYAFSIINNDKIVIDRGFFAVNAGDVFVRAQ